MLASRSLLQGSLALLVAAGLLGAQDGPPAVRRRGLVFHAPEGWTEAAPNEPERAAWTIGARASGPLARVTVTRLGVTRRPVEQHAARWARSFEGPDGRPLDAAACEREALEVEGVPATLVHLTGTWAAFAEPGAEERLRRPGWAALYVLLDGPEAQSVIALSGPADLVARHRDAVIAFARATTVGLIEPDPEPTPLPPGEDAPVEDEDPPETPQGDGLGGPPPR